MLNRLFHHNAPRWRRRLQMGILLGLSVGLLTAAGIWLGAFNPWRARAADIFYRARVPTSPIVLIAVDDRTVQEYDWPMERVSQAAFLFELTRAQPRVIVLDFFLPDAVSREEDLFFAQIIGRAERLIQPVLGIEATRYTSSLPNAFPAFDSVLKPTAILRTPNTVLAHAMVYPDPDGIARRIPFAIYGPGERIPSIALAAWTLYYDREPKIETRDNQIYFEGQRLPLDSQGQLLINFLQDDAIERVSYIDLARGKVSPDLLRDKIVLVGATARVVREAYTVPLPVSSVPLHNVEIQASLLDTLLNHNFISEQDVPSRILYAFIVSLIAGTTLIYFRRRFAVALTLAYLAIYLLLGFWQFDRGLILAPLDVVFALMLVLAATIVYRYIAEERTRAFIARIFLGSVAPEAVNDILAQYDRGNLSLSGGRRDVSVLSVTLRGINPLSEASAPEAVLQMMNQYSARIFEIVFRHGGSIHSQVANTIIAMWNLPLVHSDYAIRAVRAAFEIQNELLKLNQPSRGSNVEASFGVATGPVVVGHLPDSQRAEYSVIGDVVNVAERLSVLATQNRVIVDTPTRDQAGNDYESTPAQAIRLRGKKDAVETWELSARVTAKQIAAQ